MATSHTLFQVGKVYQTGYVSQENVDNLFFLLFYLKRWIMLV